MINLFRGNYFCGLNSKPALVRSVYVRSNPSPYAKIKTNKSELVPKNPAFILFSESIQLMIDEKKFHDVWKHWKKFRKIHLGGDVVVWNQMLQVCLLTGDVEKGIELFNDMQQIGVQYNEVTARTVLTLFLNNNAVDSAVFLIQNILERNNKDILSVYFYNLLIKYFVRTQNLHRLTLTGEHYIALVSSIMSHGLPQDIEFLMTQYRPDAVSAAGQKKKLFQLVSTCIADLLEGEEEIIKWTKIMNDCGFTLQLDPRSTSKSLHE
jgi:pentatricopeptide repeat protein